MEILDRVAEVLTHQNITVNDNIRNSREIVVGIGVLETTIKLSEDFKAYWLDFLSAQPQLNGHSSLPPQTSSFGNPVYNLGMQQNQVLQQASVDVDEGGVRSQIYHSGMHQDQTQQQAPVDLEDVALYPQDDMGK